MSSTQRTRSTSFPAILALVLVALAALAPVAHARVKTVTLTDKATGLKVTAPKGYTLKGTAAGVYTLAGNGLHAQFSFAVSPLDATGTCRALAATLPGKLTETTMTPARYVASVRKGTAVPAYLRCTQLPAHAVQVVTVTKARARRHGRLAARHGALLAPAQVSPADVAALERIVTRHTGGVPFPLALTIPTRNFTTADGKGSVNMPDLPGWACSGSQGGVDCGGVGNGYFQFGDIAAVTNDPRIAFAQSPTYVGPQEDITQLYPQYVQAISGSVVAVTAVQPVAGTAGSLGPDSGMFIAAMTVNGAPYTAMFLVKSSDAGGQAPGLWYFYFTVIAVDNSAPPGIGQAMFNAWGSWDPSVANQERIAQTLETIRTTPVPGGGIDPGVFQVAANKWDAYIRGPKSDEG